MPDHLSRRVEKRAVRVIALLEAGRDSHIHQFEQFRNIGFTQLNKLASGDRARNEYRPEPDALEATHFQSLRLP